MRQKLMFLAASVVLAFILTYPMVSDAVNGQVYLGDGATYNSTVPPGGWLFTGALDGSCFTCHGTGFANAPIKTNYLMTGHRNALRMVPAFPLTGAGGQPYNADLFSDLFNWNDSTITLQGFCTNSLYPDPTNCANGGGVWLSGSKPLYYIYGGWMNAAPGALYDGSYTQGGVQKTAVDYSCGRCHATGFTMDSTIRGCSFIPGTGFVCRSPEAYFPGITWTPSNTSGKIDLDPDGNGPATSSSWAVAFATGQSLEGIQCERCHNYTNGHNTPSIIQKGPAATALCLQCHRQEHIISYSTGSVGVNIHPTPATDNASLPVSEPVYALPAIEVGRTDGSYAPLFYDYSTGMEYLNSVHGQFTGNFQQINDSSKYLSSFVTSSTDGGCTKCHDVHESTVAAVNAAAPFKKTCPDCHQEGSASGLSTMYHPNGPGTPLGDLTNIPAGCAKCHMPKPNNGEGSASHIWRISTDASYTTFPTQTQWNAGQKTALSASTGTYPNAVWIDIDLACGQCHSGSDPVQRTAKHYFNKSALATKAAVMHSGTGSQWSTDCMTCHTNDGDPVAPQIIPGTNHHTGGCTICHTNPGVAQFSITLDSCLSCHGTPPPGMNLQPIVQGTNHHSGNCMTCHTQPGSTQFTMTTESCRSCHSAVTINRAIMPASGDAALGTMICAKCHAGSGLVSGATVTNYPGVKPNVQVACGQCHGGSNGAAGASASYQSLADLTNWAKNIHGNAPTAKFSWSTDAVTDYKVNYNASTSACPTGNLADCSVAWSTGETGVLTSHTFSSSATTTVMLTVTYSGNSATSSAAVTPKYVGSKPTAVVINSAPVNGYGVTVNYTLSGGNAPYTVKTTWGDGNTQTATGVLAGANTVTHSYLNSGTYTVTIAATDTLVNGSFVTTNSKNTSITIQSSTMTVLGLVTRSNGTTPVASASVNLKLNGVSKKLVYTATNGTYTITSVAPGTYTLTAAKSGLTFATSPTVVVSTPTVTAPTIKSTN